MLSDAIAAEIAHELRTHLQYIKMRSQFLKKSLPDFISKSSIKSSGIERLYSTPDDFIDVCDHSLKIIDSTLKKKNNQSQLVFSKFSLYSIICKAVEQYPYKRNTHKSFIDLNIESIKDKMILGNEDAVLNVFNNIISNALDAVIHNGKVIKEVKIYCSVLEKRIFVHIKDNGLGIGYNRILNVFKPFVSHKKSGTGMGLFYCKKIMDAHKGEIYCHSEKDIYTEFTMIFNE